MKSLSVKQCSGVQVLKAVLCRSDTSENKFEFSCHSVCVAHKSHVAHLCIVHISDSAVLSV